MAVAVLRCVRAITAVAVISQVNVCFHRRARVAHDLADSDIQLGSIRFVCSIIYQVEVPLVRSRDYNIVSCCMRSRLEHWSYLWINYGERRVSYKIVIPSMAGKNSNVRHPG